MKHIMIVAFMTATTTAHAQSAYDMGVIADELAAVIAAEKECGLSYDQSSISDFIDNNVPAESMGFAPRLQMGVRMAEHSLESMSESGMTAHCRSIENTARHHGFIE